MTLEQIYAAIGNLGFPIFVAVYLLVVVGKALKANTTALNQLKEVISQLCDRLKTQ